MKIKQFKQDNNHLTGNIELKNDKTIHCALKYLNKYKGHKNVQIIILGAHGCGAFNNGPKIVAKAYKDVIAEYKNRFENIVFAIPIINGKSKNYDAFKKVLF